MRRICGALALFFAAVLVALAASLPEPFAFEEAWIRAAGEVQGGFARMLAFALHYFGKFAVLVVLGAAGAYLWRGEKRMAVCVVGVPAIAALISYGLKHVFDRVRPDILPHLVHQADASFPSGHSTFAAALAVLFMLRYPRGWMVALGLALIAGMGWSRLWLGVHYPADVLAGWSVGAMTALLFYGYYLSIEERTNPFL